MRRTSYRGFSLVELLVVIGIIALLIAILMPVLNKARQQAYAVRCENNQRQIVIAMHMYANDNKGTLPLPYVIGGLSVVADPGAPGGLSDEHHPSFAIWMDNTPNNCALNWDGGALWPYLGTRDVGVREELFHCPVDYDPRVCKFNTAKARNYSYVFNADLYQMTGQILDANAPAVLSRIGARLQQIKGPEHKVLTAECDFSIVSGGNFMNYKSVGVNNLPARHSGNAYVGMADGHVESFGPAEMSNPRQGPVATIAEAQVSPQYAYYFLIYR